MDMNCHNEFYLEYCFIPHGAPALAAFSSILLIIVFIYLLPSDIYSIFLSLLSLLLIEVSSCHSCFL